MKFKVFLERLYRYRVQYFGLEQCLNKENLTASEVIEIYRQQDEVARNIAEFVLLPDENLSMLFNSLIK
jgi:hypothetical protein